MGSKVKLIIDKDLGHIIAVISANDVQPSSHLKLEDVLDQQGLLTRNTLAGKLRLPGDQLEMYDMPELHNVRLETIIERPRIHIYEKNLVTPAQSDVLAPNKSLIHVEADTNTQETVVMLQTVETLLSSKIRAKAYAQSREPNSTTQILTVREVVVTPSNKKAYIPLGLISTQIYDVLVLVEGFSALLIEGMKPKLKP
jgi:hypothetical protein